MKKSAGERNRTTDTGIFSPLLYRLSYPGNACILNIMTQSSQEIPLRVCGPDEP